MTHPDEFFQVVQDYLSNRLSAQELQEWVASRLGPIVQAEDTPAGQLALTAQHLGFALGDGEISEARFRSELARH